MTQNTKSNGSLPSHYILFPTLSFKWTSYLYKLILLFWLPLNYLVAIHGLLLLKTDIDSLKISPNITVQGAHLCPLSLNDNIVLDASPLLCLEINLKFSSGKNRIYGHCTILSAQQTEQNICLTSLSIHLPLNYVCKPSYWLSNPQKIRHGNLYMYIIENSSQKKDNCKIASIGSDNCFDKAQHRLSYKIPYPSAYHRADCGSVSDLVHQNVCITFAHQMMTWYWKESRDAICPALKDSFLLLDYPVAIASSRSMGLTFQLPPPPLYKDTHQHYMKVHQIFTFSMWILLETECKNQHCSLMHFFNASDDLLRSPLVALHSRGDFSVQGRTFTGEYVAGRTIFDFPVGEWVHIVMHWTPEKWEFWIFNQENQKLLQTHFWNPKTVYFDDHFTVGVLGTSKTLLGFDGFIGETRWYRGRLMQPDKIPLPAKDHPMFQLGLRHDQRRLPCQRIEREISLYSRRILYHFHKRLKKMSCGVFDKVFPELSSNIKRSSQRRKRSVLHQCPSVMAPLPRSWLYRIVQKELLERLGKFPDLTEDTLVSAHIHQSLADLFFNKTMDKIELEGMRDMRKEARYLRDGHCLGNLDAGYLLSMMLNYGVGNVTMNETESTRLLMLNILKIHRTSLVAMASKHKFGLDYVQQSWLHAQLYYKIAALLTIEDLERHDENDITPEVVRLIDESQLNEQTDENDDLFHWIKYNAEQGIPWAKKRMGNILYWGTQGLRRNLEQAYEFIRTQAEDPASGPEAVFNLGMAHLKGIGTDQNVTTAVEALEKAADQSNARAVNALAWVAEVHENNLTKAMQLYHKAHQLGSIEATFNLATFYHNGKYSELPPDRVTAFLLIEKAAQRGMLHACVWYSTYHSNGIPGFLNRNMTAAAVWAQFVAHQNSRISLYLREGVHAYRKAKFHKSAFNYLLAAYTGIEIGTFNLALLCEEDYESITQYIKKECVFRHYNLSVEHETQLTHPYSHIKMGDFYWYGCTGVERNINKAIHHYILAAVNNEPQGYFNLAYTLENQKNISTGWLKRVGLAHLSNMNDAIYQLYKRCEALSPSNSYLPCRLAAYRVYFSGIVKEYSNQIKIFGLGCLIFFSGSIVFVSYVRLV